MTRVIRAAAAVLLVALPVGCSLSTRAAATVNGTVINESELTQELSWLQTIPAYQQSVLGGQQLDPGAQVAINAEVVALELNRLVVFRLIDQELARRRLRITEADRRQALTDSVQQIGALVGDANTAAETFNALPPDFRIAIVERQAATGALQRSLATAAPTDAQLRQFYEAQKDSFEEACAHLILSVSEAKANEALTRVKAGEDFQAVARDVSVDEQSKASGGDVGCFSRTGDVEQVFSETAFDANVGEVVGPVESDVGWYLIQVYDKKDDTFEKAHDDVAKKYAQSGPAIALQSLLQQLVAGARVDINAKYGSWDTSSHRVLAPVKASSTSTTTRSP